MKETPNVFDEMGAYWAEMAAKNFSEVQVNFIKRTVEKQDLVLDLACGTGRHTNPLSREGYFIVGVDVSSSLLRIARKSGQSHLVRGDIRYLPFKRSVFSCILSMDTSFGYLPSEQEDLQSLREASRILKKEGTFVLDVFNIENLVLKHHRPIRRITNRLENFPFWFFVQYPNGLMSRFLFSLLRHKEYSSFTLLSKRTIVMNERRLNDLWVVRDKSDGKIRVYWHTVRLFNLCQLKAILGQANFIVERVFGGYEDEAFGPESKRLIVIGHHV